MFQRILQEINDINYPEEGIGCGLEDVGITDRYKAASYGWSEAVERIKEVIEDYVDNPWNPADEPPSDDRYILVSFSNFSIPEIAYYDRDEDGGGAYRIDTGEKTLVELGLFVSGWMELPKCKED
jgi:hypothetical protein